jgi:hypothetical protein
MEVPRALPAGLHPRSDRAGRTHSHGEDSPRRVVVKLPAHRAGPFGKAHGPEYIEWASRARSGEADTSHGSFIHIVPLPACR